MLAVSWARFEPRTFGSQGGRLTPVPRGHSVRARFNDTVIWELGWDTKALDIEGQPLACASALPAVSHRI